AELSVRPPLPPEPQWVFASDGDGYFIAGFGESGHIKRLKGLKIIATLLRTPGEFVPMLDLIDDAGRRRAVDERSPQPMMDLRAKKEARARLAELQMARDGAKEENNTAAADQAEEQIQELLKELSAAVGLGGKDRDLNSLVNKMRPTIYASLSR